MNHFDFLIIGQGLAGSLLGWELMQRGQSVLLVDNNVINASRVAAGLVNPVTGIRLVKRPDIDVLLNTAKECYSRLSGIFDVDFYTERSMLRILKNRQEHDTARKRLSEKGYSTYLDDLQTGMSGLNAPFEILEQQQTGILDTSELLACLRTCFLERGSIEQCDFDHEALSPGNPVHWQGRTFGHVIFCEGYLAQKNPYFNYLPLKPVKGEMLTLRCDKPEMPAAVSKYILNYGHWLVPVGNDLYRTGATFDRENIDTDISASARSELLHSMANVVPAMQDAIVTDQQAGIRPTTPDRAPMIGRHPGHKQFVIFNGFGTSGSLQIPYYARCLIDHLLKNIPLPARVDVARFNE